MNEIKIDKEFESLIPPLTNDEFKQLEENCLKEGIRDSLVVWVHDNESILVDGHNRYKIIQKHHLEFSTETKEFGNRSDAELWIIRNQLGRRNLSAYDRGILVLKMKPLIAGKAKEKQAEYHGNQYDGLSQKSVEVQKSKIDTQKELAKLAGVSHDTIHKVETIEKKATPEVKQKVRSGETSINKAYHDIKKIEKIEAIENSGNDFLKEQVRAGKTTIDQAYKVVTDTVDKSPSQLKKEFINEVKQERKDFQDKKEDGIVSINDIKADDKNKAILANDIYAKMLKIGGRIDDFVFDIENDEIDLKDLSGIWSATKKQELCQSIDKWVNKLMRLKGMINV